MSNKSTLTPWVAVLLCAFSVGVLAQQDRALEEQQRVQEQTRIDAERRAVERRALEEEALRSQAEIRESQRALEVTERELRDQGRELERAREELMRSRQELERAARDVARLSGLPAIRSAGAAGKSIIGMPRRPALGVTLGDAESGALITSVTPGGPAEEAGLKTGDIVVSVDGEPLAADGGSVSERLLGQLRDVEPGATARFVVSRNGETQTVDVETRANDGFFYSFGDDESFQRLVPQDVNVVVPGGGVGGSRIFNGTGFVQLLTAFSSPWREMELVPLTGQLGRYFGATEGLLVIRAPENDEIGLEDGDVILAIGGRTPSSPEHAMRILSSFDAGETIELSIMREQRARTLEYAIPTRDD